LRATAECWKGCGGGSARPVRKCDARSIIYFFLSVPNPTPTGLEVLAFRWIPRALCLRATTRVLAGIPWKRRDGRHEIASAGRAAAGPRALLRSGHEAATCDGYPTRKRAQPKRYGTNDLPRYCGRNMLTASSSLHDPEPDLRRLRQAWFWPIRFYIDLIRREAALGVCSAGDSTKVSQTFQPSGRLALSNSL
jgi:hypothetical protein